MGEKRDCPVCKSQAEAFRNPSLSLTFYECPTCGRFELTESASPIDGNHLSAYLFYHRFSVPDVHEYRYHTTMTKEQCDKFKKGPDKYNRPVHMDSDIVENWYPKSFTERMDYILLKLNDLIPHVGSKTTLSKAELLSLLFVDRQEDTQLSTVNPHWREGRDCLIEADFMLSHLNENHYLDYATHQDENAFVTLSLLPQGYSRIDGLQKNSAKGKNALCAMKFGDDTKPLREAIRAGIKGAGYNAIFIDEVQHNDFITPELLKYIRESKFVVADLTHQNNGAYFEEGYAMGLGKPVIQLCQKDTKLHFDIAQKNTIMWEKEEDIPLQLSNRIKATID